MAGDARPPEEEARARLGDNANAANAAHGATPPGAATAPNDTADGARGDGENGEAELAEVVETDIDRLVRERDDFYGALQRLQADFENFRKRTERQRQDELERALSRFANELLPVLDACELARQHGDEGAISIATALTAVLGKHGLEPMDVEGKPFDPNEHEAVAHEDGDPTAPIVVAVMRTGYRWKGRVLRPAMVKVKG